MIGVKSNVPALKQILIVSMYLYVYIHTHIYTHFLMFFIVLVK